MTRELKTAERLARSAGAAAMQHYGTATSAAKADDSPVTAADHAANRVIVQGLREAFPEDAILSEESRDSEDRLGADRVWIVDPLDGTKEFLAQNGEFSIMIGFVVDGEPVVGVVYLPAIDVLFSAAAGEGAWRESAEGRERLVAPEAESPLRMIGSRSHSEPLLEEIREALGITDVAPCGSVGVKCSRIADGRRDLYVHPVPYLKEWDTCAPEVVLREAGGWVGDCLGDPLRYNKPDPRQPHGILATGRGARERALEVVRPLYQRERSDSAGAGA